MIEMTNLDFETIFGMKIINSIAEKFSIWQSDDVRYWINIKVQEYSENHPANPERFKIRSMLSDLQTYCDLLETENPNELLKDDIRDRNNNISNFIRHYRECISKGKLTDFHGNQIYKTDKKGNKTKTPKKPISDISLTNSLIGNVRTFYKVFGKPITKKFKTFKQGKKSNRIRGISKEQLNQIYNRLENRQYRLLFKNMCLLGFRISDNLKTLTSGKYNLEKFKDHYVIYSFRSEKEGVEHFYKFLPLELTELIESIYPNYADDLTKLDLNELFMNRKGNNRITSKDFNERLANICKELGFDKKITSHDLRIYYTSTIEAISDNKINHDVKWYMTDHTIGLKEIYGKVDNIAYMYEIFINFIEPELCLQKTVIDRTSQEVLSLKEALAIKDKQLDILSKDIVELKDDVKNYKQFETRYQELRDDFTNFAQMSNRDNAKMEKQIKALTESIKELL